MQSAEKKPFMPVKDYAEQKHISVQAVYKMIKTGRIQVRKIGTYTLVRDP
jgi:predicted DNA-binding protein YlxM (UPF0122 family)